MPLTIPWRTIAGVTEDLSTVLYVAAYLLAVVDGALQEKGLYPSSPGRTGLRAFARKHPWIVLGAFCGAAAVLLDRL